MGNTIGKPKQQENKRRNKTRGNITIVNTLRKHDRKTYGKHQEKTIGKRPWKKTIGKHIYIYIYILGTNNRKTSFQ